jgi:ABC-2 type transport system permease protein
MLLPKYVTTASMAAASFASEGYLFLADYVLGAVRVAVLIAIWRTVLGPGGQASGDLSGRGPAEAGAVMTLGAVLTYTLIAQAFGEQLEPRAGITNTMWDGTFATHFTRPMNMVGQIVAEMLGRWLPGLLCFTLPLLLCAPLLGADPRPADAAHGLLFLCSLVFGLAVALCLDFIQGALTVQLQMGPWVIDRLRNAVQLVVSGALIPLALLPWGLGAAFQWLPFAAMASTPLRIYTGTGDPLSLMAGQLAWSAVLGPLAWWLWNANRERLATYGG